MILLALPLLMFLIRACDIECIAFVLPTHTSNLQTVANVAESLPVQSFALIVSLRRRRVRMTLGHMSPVGSTRPTRPDDT